MRVRHQCSMIQEVRHYIELRKMDVSRLDQHIFTEICLHYNFLKQAVALEGRNWVQGRQITGLRQDDGRKTQFPRGLTLNVKTILSSSPLLQS